ncbi:MAG: ABC transporter substrate-binding protein [Ilumatobacter sp.]|nr:MAG: ABC transporter substrate-binding protein [Ilumatobacter sp.]
MRNTIRTRGRSRLTIATAGLAALSLVVAACGGDDDAAVPAVDDVVEDIEDAVDDAVDAVDDVVDDIEDAVDDIVDDAGDDAGECETVDSVTLQLQWFVQAQFGGYYAAISEGMYDDYCLDVTIAEGGVDIVPQQQLADGAVDFAIAWVPKALQSREAGADIVNIAQIFERSGTLQVSFVEAGITTPEDFEGKRVGNWGFGNEYEVFAAITEAGLDPATDVEHVQQQFDMVALLEGDIDAAQAMTYNEYAQVLEAINPETGELYQPEDFNVISYEEVGVGMLQDAIWADAQKLVDDAEYRDIAVRFVAASIEGWAFCRDNPEACATIVTDAGSQLGESHQLWMMNEVNKLIWPAASDIGITDQAAWDRTVEIAQNTANLEGATVLAEAPSPDAFTNDIVTEALALAQDRGVDTGGSGFSPIEVELREGGE